MVALPARAHPQCADPAVYWNGSRFAPAWVTGWCRYYGEWFVRLRIRHDVWRDTEAWFHYEPGKLLPVDLDQRDARDWLPSR